jgi:membrane associated rhomboid family serine protease
MALPFRDVNPTQRPAVWTWIFLGVNVAVYLLVQAPLDGCAAAAFTYQYAAIPREVLTLQPLAESDLRLLLGPCIEFLEAPKNVPLSVVTSMFLHGNLVHLLGNALFLAVFGNNVEDRVGHTRFVVFYLLGGAVATLAFSVVHADTAVLLVGASGAIAAILGAYLVMFPRAHVYTYVPFPLYLVALLIPGVRIRSLWIIFAIVVMPAWLLLGGWFVLQAMAARSPVAGGIAYEAHIAGFLVGLVLILFLDRGRQRRGQPTYHPVRQRRPPR